MKAYLLIIALITCATVVAEEEVHLPPHVYPPPHPGSYDSYIAPEQREFDYLHQRGDRVFRTPEEYRALTPEDQRGNIYHLPPER